MRRFTWKQDTPRMQFVAIMQSVEGWVMNLESGHSPTERALGFIKDGIRQLKELNVVYTAETWEVSRDAEVIRLKDECERLSRFELGAYLLELERDHYRDEFKKL